MTIDWPHMIATMIVIFVVVMGLEQLSSYKNATRGKRFAFMAVGIFVSLTALNLVWSYAT